MHQPLAWFIDFARDLRRNMLQLRVLFRNRL
jgi:hypothetical protein